MLGYYPRCVSRPTIAPASNDCCAAGPAPLELVDQRSPKNSPEVRVHIWERLHQVRLPKVPAHPIIARVAELTGLEVAEVLEVQRLRVQPVVVA